MCPKDDFCRYAQIWLSGSRPLKLKLFTSFEFHQVHRTNTLPTSPQSLSEVDFNPNYAQKHDFGPICPNIVIWAHTPQKLKFSFFFNFTRCAFTRFQRALDHYLSSDDFEARCGFYSHICQSGHMCSATMEAKHGQ